MINGSCVVAPRSGFVFSTPGVQQLQIRDGANDQEDQKVGEGDSDVEGKMGVEQLAAGKGHEREGKRGSRVEGNPIQSQQTRKTMQGFATGEVCKTCVYEPRELSRKL